MAKYKLLQMSALLLAFSASAHEKKYDYGCLFKTGYYVGISAGIKNFKTTPSFMRSSEQYATLEPYYADNPGVHLFDEQGPIVSEQNVEEQETYAILYQGKLKASSPLFSVNFGIKGEAYDLLFDTNINLSFATKKSAVFSLSDFSNSASGSDFEETDYSYISNNVSTPVSVVVPDNIDTESKIPGQYKPGFSFGFAFNVGKMISERAALYMGLLTEISQSKLEIKGNYQGVEHGTTTEKTYTFEKNYTATHIAFTPQATLRFAVSPCVTLDLTAGYRVSMGEIFKDNTSSLVVNASNNGFTVRGGVNFHF